MARLRAHLRDEVRNRAGRAVMDGLSDFPICPCSLRRLGLTAGLGRLCQKSQTGCCRSSSLAPPKLQLREATTRSVNRALNIFFAVRQ
ncbi:hypothetical protein CRM79_10775 [Pantoea agglomerans]|nr:hypothetical protein CRM79_10775 [Pantoea agglomerans]